jgi:hypothetical protein
MGGKLGPPPEVWIRLVEEFVFAAEAEFISEGLPYDPPQIYDILGGIAVTDLR